MRVLLAAPVFSEGSTALFVWKALCELGHEILVWDFRASPVPPIGRYEVVFSWNGFFDPSILWDGAIKVLFALDDPNYGHNKEFVDSVATKYDYVFTINKFDYPRAEWLPMGWDDQVHKKISFVDDGERRIYDCDVAFIGTLRDPGRRDFIAKLASKVISAGLRFNLYGNGWGGNAQPAYFKCFAKACKGAKIVLNQHYSSMGPSTKDFEIAACAGGLLIGDDTPAKEILHSMPIYHDVNSAFVLIEKYLHDEQERSRLVMAIESEAIPYSYHSQLRNVFETIKTKK